MSTDPIALPSNDTDRLDTLRKVCLADDALHIVGVLASAGVLSVIALIVNYIKRDDAVGTIYESHMNWMIRTFWWTLVWLVPAGLIAVLSLGLLSIVLAVPVIWFLYRMIKGVLWLNDGRPMPAA
ncbi:MAG: DUF4870 family protein [Burkholderiaceae bacterium]